MTPPRIDQDRPADLSLLQTPGHRPGAAPPGVQRRPGLKPTRLQGYLAMAKNVIADARTELSEDEYGVFADIVGRALNQQKPAA